MALKKIKEYKGMNCEYWRIDQFHYDDTTDKAKVSLWLYATEEAALVKGNALYREVIEVEGIKETVVTDEIKALDLNPRDLLKTLLYAKLKESKIGQTAKLDELGNAVIDENWEQVMEDIEVNWFIDSVNC